MNIICNRINVFVGEPNVDKLNILEALDLSYLSLMTGINENNSGAGKEIIDLKSFFRVKKVADMFHLLKKHNERHQYLIVICPIIEKWLIQNAEAVNVLSETFGLANQLKEFSHMSKSTDIDKNIGFYRFIKEMIKNNAA